MKANIKSIVKEYTMKKVMSLLICAVMILSSLTFIPINTDAAPADNIIVPKNSAEIRQMVIDHVKELASIEWICPEDILFSDDLPWTDTLGYKKGMTYRGLPYVTSRNDFSDAAKLRYYIDEDGYYRGPTDFDTFPGNDCLMPRFAWGWAGGLCDINIMQIASFAPSEENRALGLIPLEGYDVSGYSWQMPTFETVCQVNGEQTMYKVYANAKKADGLYHGLYLGGSYFGNDKYMIYHNMVVSGENANVVYNDDGTINGRRSYLIISEQTSNPTIHTDPATGKAYMTSWRIDQRYSFEDLYKEGYLITRLEALWDDNIAAPTFTSDVDMSGSIGVHRLMSGSVSSNYNIFTLTATITDSTGKVVTKGSAFPCALDAQLGDMEYSVPLTELKTGKYHYNLTAEIGFGTKTIVDCDIDYKAPEDGEITIFIKDDGTGDGSSAENALGNGAGYNDITTTSYKQSALYRAVSMLSKTGGRIVVCGKVTLISGKQIGGHLEGASDFILPTGYVSDDLVFKLTSVHDGVDYRATNDAAVVMQRTFDMQLTLGLNVSTDWSDITLRCLVTPEDVVDNFCIYCYGNKTVFRESFKVESINSETGKEYKAIEINADRFPTLYGGTRHLEIEANTDLTVLGGTWRSVSGASGGFTVGMMKYGTLRGGVDFEFGGNALVFKGLNGGSGNKEGSVLADINMKITGGTVIGDIVVSGKGGFSTEVGFAKLTISGTPDLSKVDNIMATVTYATNNAPKSTILDMSAYEGLTKWVEGKYNAKSFTRVIEQTERVDKLPETTVDTTTLEPTVTQEPGVTTTVNVPKPGQSGKDNTMQIVIIVFLVAIIAVVAVVIFLLMKKPANKSQN